MLRAKPMSAAKCSARSSDGLRKANMSRIGKKPVAIPSGVTAKVDGQRVSVKGAKCELSLTVPEAVARLQPRHHASDSGGRDDHDAPAGRDRNCRYRQAPGRAGRGGNPWLASAGAL